MSKKRIPTNKPKNKAIDAFIDQGIDEEENIDQGIKKEGKEKRVKRQKYNFTFLPKFVKRMDEFLEANPHEGNSRSAFLYRVAELYMNEHE